MKGDGKRAVHVENVAGEIWEEKTCVFFGFGEGF